MSSQITEQSGAATKVAEGREEAREAGLDRKSSTWKQSGFTEFNNRNTTNRLNTCKILTPSLNRCASLLDDKKVDRVDLGWVTVTQGLTKRAWKALVNESFR